MEVVPKLEPEEAADACPQTPDGIAGRPATRHSPSDGRVNNNLDENQFEEEGLPNSVEEKILSNDVTDMTSAKKIICQNNRASSLEPCTPFQGEAILEKSPGEPTKSGADFGKEVPQGELTFVLEVLEDEFETERSDQDRDQDLEQTPNHVQNDNTEFQSLPALSTSPDSGQVKSSPDRLPADCDRQKSLDNPTQPNPEPNHSQAIYVTLNAVQLIDNLEQSAVEEVDQENLENSVNQQAVLKTSFQLCYEQYMNRGQSLISEDIQENPDLQNLDQASWCNTDNNQQSDVIEVDEAAQEVKCPFCDQAFPSLGSHLKSGHNIGKEFHNLLIQILDKTPDNSTVKQPQNVQEHANAQVCPEQQSCSSQEQASKLTPVPALSKACQSDEEPNLEQVSACSSVIRPLSKTIKIASISQADETPNNFSRSVQCPGCPKMFLSIHSLKMHLSKSHKLQVSAQLVLIEPLKTQLRRSQLQLHETVAQTKVGKKKLCQPQVSAVPNQADAELQCPRCPRMYPLIDDLMTHMLKSHQLNETFARMVLDKKFVCGQCSKAFPSNKHLGSHKRWHIKDTLHLVTDVTVPDDIVGDVEASGDVEPSLNETDDDDSVVEDAISVQDVTASEEVRENLDCPFCMQMFDNQSHLTAHMKISHRSSYYTMRRKSQQGTPAHGTPVRSTPGPSSSWPVRCNYCDIILPDLDILRWHQVSVHYNVEKSVDSKPCKCCHCEESFMKMDQLRSHLIDGHGLRRLSEELLKALREAQPVKH